MKGRNKVVSEGDIFASNLEEVLTGNAYIIIDHISPHRKSLVGGIMKNSEFKKEQSVFVYNKDGLHSKPTILALEVNKNFVDEALENKPMPVMLAQEGFSINDIILKKEINIDTLRKIYK